MDFDIINDNKLRIILHSTYLTKEHINIHSFIMIISSKRKIFLIFFLTFIFTIFTTASIYRSIICGIKAGNFGIDNARNAYKTRHAA